MIPGAWKLLPNPVVRAVLDSWVISGIGQFATGTPAAVGFSTTDGTNLNGGGDTQRMDICGGAYSGSVHTFSSWFNPSAFCRPKPNGPGNARNYDLRNPRANNWDLPLASTF